MKLLNREPTEEMGSACDYESSRNAYSFHQHLTTYWQAMYDAAPVLTERGIGELKHELELVATLQHKANQAVLDAANTALAERNTLQAENERLRKENEELKETLTKAQNSDEHNFNRWQSVVVERDELVRCFRGLQEALADQEYLWYHDLDVLCSSHAKHEGDKHE